MFKRLKNIIPLVAAAFFIWFFYLIIKGFIVTSKQDMVREEWPSKIIGNWKNCKEGVCFNLQFNPDYTCKIILIENNDTSTILGTYKWEAGIHYVSQKKARRTQYEKENEIVSVTLNEPDSNNRYTNYKYTIQSIKKEEMELTFSNEGSTRKFTKY
jgi:hypothetical protein